MAFTVTNTFTAGTKAKASEVNTNYTDIENEFNGVTPTPDNLPHIAPIGGIISWLKTFDSQDSGTTTTTTTGKLVESGQNFTSTVSVGMIIHNTTDSTFTYVTAVDSDTTLSVNDDVMPTGKAYTIYATRKLEDSWVECNGQVLSDADSVYNGATIPDLNASSGTARFLRGSTTSGSTANNETHFHRLGFNFASSGTLRYVEPGGLYGTDGSFSQNASISRTGTGSASYSNMKSETITSLPSYYEVVWIMRVK